MSLLETQVLLGALSRYAREHLCCCKEGEDEIEPTGHAAHCPYRKYLEPKLMMSGCTCHIWLTDKDGSVESFEVGGRHQGPRCAVCGYWYCEICHPEGPPEKECEP